jgi:ABC-type Co2+ transport system permease subunit
MNPSSIAVVRVKRPSRTWIGTVVGYMAAAVACALIADADDVLSTRDLIVVGGVGGIPGALIGGYIGHRSGGDFEIVP